MKTLLFCTILAGALAAPSGKPKFRLGLNKIVGGTDATPGEIPYQLSFQDTSFGFDFHFCGASIYKPSWGITAGHCVDGNDFDNPQDLQVVAGEHNLVTDEGNEQKQQVDKIILHEDFNGETISNDVALINFASPLTFNDYVDSISLQGDKDIVGVHCIVSGWGATSEGGNSPDVLQKVTVPTVSDEECRQSYSGIDDSMICAGVPEGGKDSCQGDSGGPMACGGLLTGIVSWGYGCARPGYPGVYCEVAYFKDWIEANAV